MYIESGTHGTFELGIRERSALEIEVSISHRSSNQYFGTRHIVPRNFDDRI